MFIENIAKTLINIEEDSLLQNTVNMLHHGYNAATEFLKFPG